MFNAAGGCNPLVSTRDTTVTGRKEHWSITFFVKAPKAKASSPKQSQNNPISRHMLTYQQQVQNHTKQLKRRITIFANPNSEKQNFRRIKSKQARVAAEGKPPPPRRGKVGGDAFNFST
jgi:hypothetical protein